MGDETRLVAGRYATIRELGRGGMGVVWLAEDRVIGRQVALKELRTTETERVLREARTAGRLNSPNVVGIYDVIVEHGVTYLVMELVEAPTLSEVMARRSLTEDEVANIGLQTLNALEAAHAAGIVHRDVKPSNIMVLPDGRVKLADFGIARAMDDPGLTATGGIMGSPGYMAPELFAGKQPSPASDLWALGATMFHAVEGRSPFQRDTTAATMHAIMYEQPVLQRTRGPLADTVMALLAQDDTRRLTAAQLRERLSGATTTVKPLSPSEQTVVIEPVTSFVAPNTPTHADWDEKPRSRKKVGLFAGAAAVVVVVALAAVFLVRPETRQGEAAAAQQGLASGQPSSTASSAPSSTAASSSSAAPSSSSAAPSSTQTSKSVQATQPGQPPQQTTPPAPPRESLVFSRYRNGNGWHYSGTPNIAVPPGFAVENTGGLGKLLAKQEPSTKALYSCVINNSEDRMTSSSPSCEGQTRYGGVLGYVFTAKPAGVKTLPLYRCNLGGHHFDSVLENCEGYKQEFLQGWVLA